MTEKSVAILGAGRMGRAIARRLHRAGWTVRVWNRTAERLHDLQAEGIFGSTHLPDVLAEPSIWLTALADGPVTYSVWSMDGGMRGHARSGVLWVQMGTLDYTTTVRLAQEALRVGMWFLDAPVLGSVREAEAGRLVVMVGGDPDVIARAETLFATLGHVVQAGAVGAGTLMKLTSNLLLAHMMEGFAEWMNFGQQVGLDPLRMWEVIKHSKLYCPMFEGKFRSLYEETFQASFPLKWMLKDLWAILDAGRRFSAYTPVTMSITSVYQAAFHHGYGEDDYAAVHQLLRMLSGTAPERAESAPAADT